MGKFVGQTRFKKVKILLKCSTQMIKIPPIDRSKFASYKCLVKCGHGWAELQKKIYKRLQLRKANYNFPTRCIQMFAINWPNFDFL